MTECMAEWMGMDDGMHGGVDEEMDWGVHGGVDDAAMHIAGWLGRLNFV